MNGGAIAILVIGVGAAAFLYYRSQAQQAAALAAAQSAPGPGLIQKIENTAKVVGSKTPSLVGDAVFQHGWRGVVATGGATAVASHVASGAASAVSFVKGLI